MIVTIAIPYAPHHEHLVQRAVDSAYAQTIPCAVRVFHDHERVGAGYARNQLLELTKTPFIVFLDGDDFLEPTFVEDCLSAYRPGYYVYTDYRVNGKYNTAPLCDEWITAWTTGGHERMHLVTTLLPMAIPKRLKGFDEKLPAVEDTDFYLRLRTRGYCGIAVHKPLVHYSTDGQRSEAFRQRSDRDKIRAHIHARYEGQIVMCCGNPTTTPQTPGGERQDGDVLAMAVFSPRSEFGMATGRFYRPKFNGEKLWVARADAQARPDMWRLIEDPEANTPDVDFVADMLAKGLAEKPLAALEPEVELTAEDVQAATSATQAGDNYEVWLVDDLRREVERRGLTPSARRKAQYIEALRLADGETVNA